MKKLIVLKIIFFSTILVITSCSKNNEEKILLDNSYPLALAPDVSWAVVTDPYVAYKADKSWESDVVGYCRRGEILQVQGKSQDSTGEVWYYFENGWLSSDCIRVYNNRYKAKSVADSMEEKS